MFAVRGPTSDTFGLDVLEHVASSRPVAALEQAQSHLGRGCDGALHRIMGVAFLELGRLGDARRSLEKAVALADDDGDGDLCTVARTSLAHVMLQEGDLGGADRTLTALMAGASGRELGRAMVNLSLVKHRQGLLSEAVTTAREALRISRRAGDTDGERRGLNNLGVFTLESGDLVAARRWFRLAEDRAAGADDQHTLVRARHNRGVAEMRAGNVPFGFALTSDAIARWRVIEAALPLARALLDHADALIGASLLREAADAVDESVSLASLAGAPAEMADGWVRAANIGFLRGHFETAFEASTNAVNLLEAQSRVPDARNASLVRSAAALLTGRAVDSGVIERLALDDRFEMTRTTVDVRLKLAESLRRLDRTALADQVIAPLLRLTFSKSPLMRISGHEAQALHGLIIGDWTSAARSADTGLRLVTRHALSLRSTELRLGVARRVDALAAIRIEIGVLERRPDAVLAAIEARGHAGFAMGLGPERPGSKTGALLGELRTVVAQLASPNIDGSVRLVLEERERSIEREIRATSRALAASGPHRSTPTLASRAGRALLKVPGRLTVLFGDSRDGCVRLTIGPGASPIEAVLDLGELRAVLSQLRLVTRRLASDTTGRWGPVFDGLAARVDDILLAGVDPAGLDSILVIPSPSVADVPWAALPRFRDRALSVSPSLQVALRSASAARAPRSVVAVAGPNLAHADQEAKDVARIHGGLVHRGRRATSECVRGAFATADLLHLATHGSARDDNPSMSSLQLSDGPLTVYDLEDMPRVAPVVVLSSCSVGRPGPASFSTVSSFVAVLLAKGTRTVIAATDPVSDQATTDLMSELHGEMSHGAPPSLALSRAQGRVGHPTARLFTCWGSAPFAS